MAFTAIITNITRSDLSLSVEFSLFNEKEEVAKRVVNISALSEEDIKELVHNEVSKMAQDYKLAYSNESVLKDFIGTEIAL